MTNCRLRPMREGDLEQVWRWRNHPEVRRYMYTTHEIEFKEHCTWFSRAHENDSIHLLIYEREGKAHGFMNITQGRCPEVADWGFYVSPDAPNGAGRQLGEHALRYAFEVLRLHKLCGQALGFNNRSIAFHRSLGFTEEGRLRDQHCDGTTFYDVICFGLLIDEWRKQLRS